ncbi:MAG: T9SS type A sorting domain-containing protein [Flavobacteriales bacterium]|nr:T9SS type A sorting domain-containing protein [Flavobacteriales bacterium]
MKKALLLATLVAFTFGRAHAQCVPNPLYNDSLFGVWPDTIQGFAVATVGQFYSDTLNLKVPSDAGIVNPAFAGLTIDSVQFTGISGLPAGLSTSCTSHTPANCTYLTGIVGCGLIEGTPTTAGTYPLTIDVTAYTTVIVPIPVPYTFTGYSITVQPFSNVVEITGPNMTGVRNVPNPFANRTTIDLNLNKATPLQVRIYNLLGEELWKEKVEGRPGLNRIPFESGKLQDGVYIYSVRAGDEQFTGRMVLNR